MSERGNRVVVTGIGLITALGDDVEGFERALCAGESAVREVAARPESGLPTVATAELEAFDGKRYLGEKSLRPLDRTARLAASAAQRALASSGLAELLPEREIGLVLGTMFGSLRTISDFDRRAVVAGPGYAKPMAFANSVINAAAGQTAIWHGLAGINATISGGLTSGLQAIAYASDLIRSGRSRALLAGGADELCLASLHGFHRRGLVSQARNGDGTCAVPFDARRNGIAPGEAAALLVLESEESAAERGATVLAEISGHGTAFDCSRGRVGERAAAALADSVRLALADAAIEPRQIDAVSAGANGSPEGDRREALGLEAVFNGSSEGLPVTAVKSMLGEALAASGALQAAAAIAAMGSGRLPGIRGFERREEEFPLAGAGAETRELEVSRALITSLGFDGKACSLVVTGAGR